MDFEPKLRGGYDAKFDRGLHGRLNFADLRDGGDHTLLSFRDKQWDTRFGWFNTFIC
jgi:hypothetical protein